MEPIAVIGLGCRFPGAPDPDAYWRLLASGTDAISEVPADRWPVDALYDPSPAAPGKTSTRWGGFLRDVDQFDADFFGFSAFEAERMDPQQRLVLEVAWEALENAGVVPAALAGSSTGVFLGVSHSDYDRLIYKDLQRISPIHGISTYHCIAANRLSYVLDLRGPSLAIDTACSSALVAAHLACQSLRSHECDLAIVGGVNLMLSPEETIGLSKAGMMAADGRCKTFDQSADGYVRGEGCGILILKRAADARADGDRVLARLRGSAMNQGGLTNGLGAPNGPAQQALLRRALAVAGVAPAQVSYVEAQGLGTALGDQIEVRALRAVLSADRAPEQRCYIGSVKTNIGHLEAASGAAGLIKIILALAHERIPAHLNVKRLNAHISLQGTPFSIPLESAPWPRTSAPRIAGITAIGFGGTNCHIVVEEGPLPKLAAMTSDRPRHVLTLSARSESALRELAVRYREFLVREPAAAGADVAFTANTSRSSFNHRLATSFGTVEQLRERLDAFARGIGAADWHYGQPSRRREPKAVFVFDANDAQCRALWRAFRMEPAFRRALETCNDAFRRQTVDGDFVSISEELAATELSARARFAVQYACAELWREWGVAPAAVIAAGAGEYAARCFTKMIDPDSLARFLTSPPDQLADLGVADPTVPVVLVGVPERPMLSAQGQRVANRAAALRMLFDRDRTVFLDIATARVSRDDLTVEMSDAESSADAVWESVTHALAALHVLGAPIDWRAFDAPYARRRLALPTYPFERRRYWFEPLADSTARAASAQPVAAVRDQPKPQAFDAAVVELQKGRPGKLPLFLVHPVHGSVFCYQHLVQALPPDQPVYGIQAPTLGGARLSFLSLEAMAQAYLACARHVQPSGVLHLSGWSMGGAIIYEMAQQLRQRGETAKLLLIDTYRPSPEWVDGEGRALLLASVRERDTNVDGARAAPRADWETELRELMKQAAAQESGAPRGADDSEWARRLDLLRHHIELFRRYQPRPFEQPLLLARAETVLGRDEPAPIDLGWSELAPAVAVFELPGDHYGVLGEPNANRLAGILRRELLGEAFAAAGVSGNVVSHVERPNVAGAPTSRRAAEIEQWAVAWLSRYLGADPGRIDPNADFTRFGVNSITVVQFLKELGVWLGTALSPTSTWKFRTIRALAEHLGNGGTITPSACEAAASAPETVEGVL